MRVLVDLHRQPGRIPHRSAVLERRAGLFQHHVEAGDGAPDPRRVEPRGAAVPVAIDKRCCRHRLADQTKPRDVGFIVAVGAELYLKLCDAARRFLDRDPPHLVGIDAGNGMIERQARRLQPAEKPVKRQPGQLRRQVPERDVERRFRIDMADQVAVGGLHHRLGAEGRAVAGENHRRQLVQRRCHPAHIGGKVMRDRADLAPAGKPVVGLQPKHARRDRVADLAVRHVVGKMTCQRHMPQRQSVDVHGGHRSLFSSRR